MKQKLTALLLALALSLTAPAYAAEVALPAVGKTLFGFQVTSRDTLDLNGAPTVTLEHVKSGATVYYVASQDLNRTFDITFRTPALDDRGMSHILEHCSLSGGKKYTSPNLFFAAANQTYNTFVNAMTDDTTTTYPVSSLSEDQLLVLMDLYLDGVLHPMLYTDRRIFQREAWRYALPDADAPITLTGTVYNEMKGAMDISRTAQNNALNALFPDTILGSNSGGEPQSIPDLTWEALVSYHKTYYHPSNALIVLNGQLDLSRFLRFMDENYLSQYTKIQVSVENGTTTPLTTPATARYEYPVEQGAAAEQGSVVCYGMAMADHARDDIIGLNLLADILSQDTSPVSTAVSAALPRVHVSAHVGFDFAHPYVIFTAEEVREGDAPIFRAAVERGLAQLVTDGLPKGVVSSAAAKAKLAHLSLTESSQFGPSLSSMVAARWAADDGLDYMNYYGKALDRLNAKEGTDYFQSLAKTYLVGNPWAALTVTVPVPGLKERQDAAAAETLSQLKASLTAEEIAAMVQSTADFSAWSAQTPSKDQVAALRAVSVKDLPEAVRSYPVTDNTKNGVRFLTAQSDSAGLNGAMLALDLSALPNEDLHWANLYGNLVGKMGTDTDTLDQITARLPQTLGSFSAYTALLPDGADRTLALAVQWIGPAGDPDAALALAGDLLFHTDLTDVAALKNIVAQLRATQKSAINAQPNSLQTTRAQALVAPKKYAAYNYMTGLDYYAFLDEVATRLTLNPNQVVEKLTTLQTTLCNGWNATTMFAGSKHAVTAWEAAASDFWSQLPQQKTTPVDRTGIPLPAHREAIAADASVQYNTLSAPLSALGLEDSGKLDVAFSILTDRYLTPQSRHVIGAYGAGASINEDGLTLSTFRDPALTKTYEVFAAAPAAMSALDLTRGELDGYIMSIYSSLARPRGPLTAAMNAMSYHLMGEEDATLTRMRQVKSTTLADLTTMAPALTMLNQIGFRSTVGGQAILEENATLFDAILYPLGRTEPTLTRGQAVALLPGAVLLGDGTGSQNGDAPLTREQLAVLLHRMSGSLTPSQAAITDLPQVSPWAREAVRWCVSIGLLTTDEAGCFNPHAEATKSMLLSLSEAPR